MDTNTGTYVTFTDENIPFEDLPQACVASGSLPVVFPPQQMYGYVLMDGGVAWNTNINTAVQKCRNMGYDDPDIIVDLAVCGYQTT